MCPFFHVSSSNSQVATPAALVEPGVYVSRRPPLSLAIISCVITTVQPTTVAVPHRYPGSFYFIYVSFALWQVELLDDGSIHLFSSSVHSLSGRVGRGDFYRSWTRPGGPLPAISRAPAGSSSSSRTQRDACWCCVCGWLARCHEQTESRYSVRR
ncbi:hypothetical protein LZ30DRAFT_350326 [Colletotrichum cereale]|nr:hypothetical protein LZ30DRAFT_350326 [Colletotrichum cereale]